MTMKMMLAACASVLLVAGTAEAQKVKQPPACGADVFVNATVLNTAGPTGDGTYFGDYVLRSDGGGAYVHGSGRISSYFQNATCYWDWTLNLNGTSRRLRAYLNGDAFTPVTFFNFDRIGSVPVTAPTSDAEQTAFNRFCGTVGATDPAKEFGKPQVDGTATNATRPDPLDNYGGCGVDGAGHVFVRRTVGIQLEIKGTDQRLRMQASPYDARATTCNGAPEVCQTSYVRVYRPTATTWEISPEPSNPLLGSPDLKPVAAELAYPRTGGATYVGWRELPFRILLTKK